MGTVTGDATLGYTVTDDTVDLIRYDSNDRFNIIDGGSQDAAGYAEFEQSLHSLAGFVLSRDVVDTGSRAVNAYTLTIPTVIDPVIYW